MVRGLVGKGQPVRGQIKVSKKGISKEEQKAFKDALRSEARRAKGTVKVSK